MKTKILFFLFFLLLSCSEDPEFTGPPAARSVLRILDINVWSGLDYRGNLKMGEYETGEVRGKRYRALLTQIDQLHPDIIGVHEANKLPDYAGKLAEALGYDAFYHVGVGGVRLGKVGLPWNLREGDAILTKRDLRGEFAGRQQLSGGHVGNFFTFHFSDATQVIAVKVMNRGEPFYIFATHWHASILEDKHKVFRNGGRSEAEFEDLMQQIQAGVEWRLSESEKTTAFIEEIAGSSPFVLMGDFNATAKSEEIANLLQFGMIDAFRMVNPAAPGFTWNPEMNLNVQKHYLARHKIDLAKDLNEKAKRIHESTPKRIDFIFAGPGSLFDSGEIFVKSSRVVMDEIIDGVHASDHFGVFAELEFK